MQKEEFLKIQLTSLRDEIRDTKGRIFKTLGFGLSVVPAAHFLAQAYEVDILLITIPILVKVVALLYLSENHALMRCGRYIRLCIEPHVPEVLGWEKWLATPDEIEKRTVERYLTFAFYLLFLVYYVGSVFLAVRFALTEYGRIAGYALLAFYSASGLGVGLFLVRKMMSSTTTATESEASKTDGRGCAA